MSRNTDDGSRILEIAANGVISTPKKVDLRSLGCPDWLASKVEGAREVRRAAPAAPAPPKIRADSVAAMRKLFHIMAAPLLKQTKRELPYPAPYTYDSLRQHMDVCSAMMDCAYATADTVEDLLDNWPEDEENSRAMKRDLHNAFRAAHRETVEALSQTLDRMAVAHLHLAKVTNKVMSKGNGGNDN